MSEEAFDLSTAWEQACARVLMTQLSGWVADTDHIGPGSADLALVKPETGERIVADFKLFRSPYVPGHWLARAFSQIELEARRLDARSAYLLTSSRLSARQALGFRTQIPIQVWDVDQVRRVANRDAALLEEIDAILARAGISTSSNPIAHEDFQPDHTGAAQHTTESAGVIQHPPKRGDLLCTELRAIQQLGRNFKEYEVKVEEVLRYLFDDELDGWARQNEDDDSLRCDISARILKRHLFWTTLASDFRTRFVLFECKNYSERVSQAEVHSTEKYLFPAALRSFAIIVSPHGVDNGAEGAMKGALRESGRLITWLSNDDLCKMLTAHDRGDEIYDLLSERLDRMLLTIAR